jgi:hypothetical protein
MWFFQEGNCNKIYQNEIDNLLKLLKIYPNSFIYLHISIKNFNNIAELCKNLSYSCEILEKYDKKVQILIKKREKKEKNE